MSRGTPTATFRIDPDLWRRFGERCTDKSAWLRDRITAFVDAGESVSTPAEPAEGVSTPERGGGTKWSQSVQAVSASCPMENLTTEEVEELHGAAEFLRNYCRGELVTRHGKTKPVEPVSTPDDLAGLPKSKLDICRECGKAKRKGGHSKTGPWIEGRRSETVCYECRRKGA